MPDENETRRLEASYQEELDKEVGEVMTATEEPLVDFEKAMGDAASSMSEAFKGEPIEHTQDVPGVISQSEADIRNWFTYHRPKGDQAERYGRVREAGKAMALVILDECPPSAERTVAIRKIREATFMANAAIACNE